MKTRRLILAALWINCLFATSTAETVSAPSCITPEASYLLAGNSGALIRVAPETEAGRDAHVIVFRPQPARGWASQRLLMQFDLKLDDEGGRIRNTGAFCREEK